MNLGGLLLLFVIIIGAVMGLAFIGAKTLSASEVRDTYGSLAGNETNQSQSLVQNLSATGQQVGGGALLLVVGIIGAVVILALIAVVATGKW